MYARVHLTTILLDLAKRLAVLRYFKDEASTNYRKLLDMMSQFKAQTKGQILTEKHSRVSEEAFRNI